MPLSLLPRPHHVDTPFSLLNHTQNEGSTTGELLSSTTYIYTESSILTDSSPVVLHHHAQAQRTLIRCSLYIVDTPVKETERQAGCNDFYRQSPRRT